jgi:hypothetical protein
VSLPSEIVPTILDEVRDTWKRRLSEERREFENRNLARIGRRKPEPIPHDATQRILREVWAEYQP